MKDGMIYKNTVSN
jgi:hypothetical protein